MTVRLFAQLVPIENAKAEHGVQGRERPVPRKQPAQVTRSAERGRHSQPEDLHDVRGSQEPLTARGEAVAQATTPPVDEDRNARNYEVVARREDHLGTVQPSAVRSVTTASGVGRVAAPPLAAGGSRAPAQRRTRRRPCGAGIPPCRACLLYTSPSPRDGLL